MVWIFRVFYSQWCTILKMYAFQLLFLSHIRIIYIKLVYIDIISYIKTHTNYESYTMHLMQRIEDCKFVCAWFKVALSPSLTPFCRFKIPGYHVITVRMEEHAYIIEFSMQRYSILWLFNAYDIYAQTHIKHQRHRCYKQCPFWMHMHRFIRLLTYLFDTTGEFKLEEETLKSEAIRRAIKPDMTPDASTKWKWPQFVQKNTGIVEKSSRQVGIWWSTRGWGIVGVNENELNESTNVNFT